MLAAASNDERVQSWLDTLGGLLTLVLLLAAASFVAGVGAVMWGQAQSNYGVRSWGARAVGVSIVAFLILGLIARGDLWWGQ